MPPDPAVIDIDRMPGGGPDASWVDRRLQTDRLEYLDRDDVDDRVKRQIVGSLETLGSLLKDHEKFARLPLDEVADVADPTILDMPTQHQLRAHKEPWGRQIVVASRPGIAASSQHPVAN